MKTKKRVRKEFGTQLPHHCLLCSGVTQVGLVKEASERGLRKFSRTIEPAVNEIGGRVAGSEVTLPKLDGPISIHPPPPSPVRLVGSQEEDPWQPRLHCTSR